MQTKFMEIAIELALEGLNEKGFGPFGAVIVKDNKIIGSGVNQVTRNNDPSAHAEVCAIRAACKNLQNFSLAGCEIYTTCEPCPMCMGAIYWSRLSRVYYGADRHHAAKINFDDAHIYQELKRELGDRKLKMEVLLQEECLKIFSAWENKVDKIHY